MFRWDLVWHFLFEDPNLLFLNAAWRTLWISVVAQTAGVFLGLFLALMRMSRFPLLTFPARAYIWFFRGSPLLVQVLLLRFFCCMPLLSDDCFGVATQHREAEPQDRLPGHSQCQLCSMVSHWTPMLLRGSRCYSWSRPRRSGRQSRRNWSWQEQGHDDCKCARESLAALKIATASQVPQVGGQVILPLEERLRNGDGGNDLLLAVVRIGTIVVRTHKARYIRRAAGRIAEVVADEGLST